MTTLAGKGLLFGGCVALGILTGLGRLRRVACLEEFRRILSSLARELTFSLRPLPELADLAQVSPQLLRPMLQTVGLALVTKLASALCKDAGEGSLAAFVEVAGSAAAVLVALPLLRMVLQLMLGLL